ncbi:hypothetical protein ACFOEN_14655 [Piscinibacterium candidicorallinum]|uniref:Uncharacterized protein n=1 Tax=Piscinibacterium candidicorallinum TaxID=1793872 RepID=A0ABV7H803_9BURK
MTEIIFVQAEPGLHDRLGQQFERFADSPVRAVLCERKQQTSQTGVVFKHTAACDSVGQVAGLPTRSEHCVDQGSCFFDVWHKHKHIAGAQF